MTEETEKTTETLQAEEAPKRGRKKVKQAAHDPEAVFQDALAKEIDFWGEESDYIILKKYVFQGKKSRKSQKVPVPLVIHLKNASTTADHINRLVRQGWPIVHYNFVDGVSRFDRYGNPIVDDRVRGVKNQILAYETQIAGAQAMKKKGTALKYQEALNG